jgi:hypothetical protein
MPVAGMGKVYRRESARVRQPHAALSDKQTKVSQSKPKTKIPQDFRPEGFDTT